jgi:L-fucose isomerase and related proteins
MKQRVKIGVVCLARTTYEHETAQKMYGETIEKLTKIENVDFYFERDCIIEVEDAKASAKRILAEDVDGLIIISGTFHLGHLALTYAKDIKKPFLLWAPSELPYDGGKIRLNSVCGINLNASNLYKVGKDDCFFVFGDAIDEEWIDALRIKATLERAHVGLVGYRAHGFFNVGVDDLDLYKKTGILIDHYEITDMFMEECQEEELAMQLVEVKQLYTCKEVSEEQVEKVARLCVSAKKFIERNELSAVAVRCWPEFASAYGVSPCASMSILQSKGYIMSCEGDVEGALSMLAGAAIGVETPYLADLSQVDIEQDFALMWHCGVAPANLWDGQSDRSLDTYFAGGKGVTAGFVMKQGHVNMMRIDTARGKTRMFLGAGESIAMEKQLCGTYCKVRFEKRVDEVFNLVCETGIAHHVAMYYGEYRSVLRKAAKMLNFEVIES